MIDIRIDHIHRTIILSEPFAKKCSNPDNRLEFAKFEETRKLCPSYEIIIKKIARNKDKQTFSGCNFEFMEYYIRANSKNVALDLFDFSTLKLITKGEDLGSRFQTIRAWFFDVFPEALEIKDFKQELNNIKMHMHKTQALAA